MIDVYFLLLDKRECLGAISLREMHPNMKINIWQTYKVYQITENIVLFERNEKEFCVINGIHEHEMGTIKIETINGEWLHINVREKS